MAEAGDSSGRSQLVASLLCLGLLAASPAPQGEPLAVGAPYQGRLADGELKVFRLELPADVYLRLDVDPVSIDLDVRLRGPGGELLAEVDSRTGRPSPRFLAARTPAAGSYELTLQASSKQAGAGDFVLVLAEKRPATREDTMCVAAGRELNVGFRLSEEGSIEAGEKALEHFTATLKLYRDLADPAGQAVAYYWIGLQWVDLHRYSEALEPFQRSLELWRPLGRKDQEAELLLRIGTTQYRIGQLAEALASLQRAVNLWQEVGDRKGEALASNNLSYVFRRRNQFQLALDYCRRARELFHDLGLGANEAKQLVSLSSLYQLLGDLDRSLDQLEEARPILHAVGDRYSEAVVLNDMGWVHRQRGEPEKALELYREAFDIAVENHHPTLQATALGNIGRLRLELGEAERALRDFENALEIYRRYGTPRDQCAGLIRIGAALRELDKPEQAVSRLEEALDLSRRHGFRKKEADALFQLARTLRRVRPEEALSDVEAALAIVEEARTDLDSHSLKASFLAYRQPFHELRIDLLMSSGREEEALAAHERGRGRGLLETLAEAGTELRSSAPPELLAEERRLHQRLNERALAKARLSAGGSSEELIAAEKEIRELLRNLDDVAAKIREANPGYAHLVQPPPLDLATLRGEVLDGESLLLEIALGEERSFLWAVTTDSFEAFVLPPRARIESVARRFYELLSDGEAWRGEDAWAHGLRYREAAAELSGLVLAPAAERLGGRRLLIVADGALCYIPFAALPRPGTSQPLILGHEVVSLPSASILAFLRRERAGRPRAPHWLAILADPVYQASDVRLAVSGPPSGEAPPATDQDSAFLERSAREVGLGRLSRLRYSGREAEAVAALVPAGESRLALGLDANRTFAIRELGGYRWLHFATHGFFNSQTPELSGLALSLFDARGRPQDGFLRLHDIYNLRLNADLVVLSACQTALGKEIRGEGLIGLTRGFLHAGARRVVASLWRIEDEATAVLVERFYAGMLGDDLRPAAALRQAQLEMLESPRRRWRAPHFWAAFVLQGEWR